MHGHEVVRGRYKLPGCAKQAGKHGQSTFITGDTACRARNPVRRHLSRIKGPALACLHERYGQWQEDDSDTTDSYQIHTVTVPRRSRRGYHKPSQWRRKMVDFINKAQSFTKYLIFKQPVGHGRSSPEKYDLRQIFRSYEAKSELFNEEDRENMAALDLMQRGAAVDQC